MYWILDPARVTDDEGGFLEIDDLLDLPDVDQDEWLLGSHLDLELPPSLELTARPRNGYAGPPPDFHDSRLCLMSEKMVRILRNNGVGNIETCPLTLVNRATDEQWPYFFVNVIGLLAAADMKKSIWYSDHDPLAGDTEFDSLVIDERLCNGVPIFRLAQNRDLILVSDRLRSVLEGAGLLGVSFVDPSCSDGMDETDETDDTDETDEAP